MDWASVVEHLYQQNFCSCCPLVCPSGNSAAQRHWGVTAFPSTIDMARLPWKPWQIGTSSNSLSNELMIMCWHPFFIFVRLAIIKVYRYKRSDIIELELMPVAFNENVIEKEKLLRGWCCDTVLPSMVEDEVTIGCIIHAGLTRGSDQTNHSLFSPCLLSFDDQFQAPQWTEK